MRHAYSLTPATKKTLKQNVTKIAAAMDISERMIYKILAEEANDPLAPAFAWYEAICEAGVSTTFIDSEFEHIRHRHEQHSSAQLRDALNRAVKRHGELVEHCFDAMSDGVWSLDEIEKAEEKAVALQDQAGLLLQGFKRLRQRAEATGNVPCDESTNGKVVEHRRR